MPSRRRNSRPSPQANRLIAAYIPNVFQDHYVPLSEILPSEADEDMGSQILIEPTLEQNNTASGPGNRRSTGINISGIPSNHTLEEMHNVFSAYGVQTCNKGPVQSDGSYNIQVTFETPEQAQRAINDYSNYEIEPGHFLKVDYLHNQGRRYNRMRTYSQYGYSGQAPGGRANDFPLRISVSSDMVGAIIGRGGATIRQITQLTRARVDINRKDGCGDGEKIITIFGTPESCSSACEKILQVMQNESATQGQGDLPLKILAHNNLIGRLIGKNGSNIKRIMEQTGAKVTVSGAHDVHRIFIERIITVRGSLENICKAEKMISKKLHQSYENDMANVAPHTYMFPGVSPPVMLNDGLSMPPPWYQSGGVMPRGMPPSQLLYPSPGYSNTLNYPPYSSPLQPRYSDDNKEEVCIFIANSFIGAIIGSNGSTIREMISASGATIKVTPTPPNEKLDRNALRRVTVQGTPEAQWKAQFMIFKKVGFDNCVVSLKVEILVPSNQVGRIIGKGGRRIKEFQHLTMTKIRIPEEFQRTEAPETPIHITGDFYGSQAAQRQIRALLKSTYTANDKSAAATTTVVAT